MPIDLYPNIAKIKRNGAYQNLPGFVQQSDDGDIEAMIANKETNTTAQYAHLKDSYFILNDVLYKATANISVNDIIAVGTNCEVAVIGNELFNLISEMGNYNDVTKIVMPDNVELEESLYYYPINIPNGSVVNVKSKNGQQYNRSWNIIFYGTDKNNILQYRAIQPSETSVNITITVSGIIYARPDVNFSVGATLSVLEGNSLVEKVEKNTNDITTLSTSIANNTKEILEIKSGKNNLYEGITLISGRVYQGVYSDAITTVHCTDYLPVTPSRKYAIYGGYFSAEYSNYFDQNKTYKGSLPLDRLVNSYPYTTSYNCLIFTAPSDCYYVRLNYFNSDLVDGTALRPEWYFRDITGQKLADKNILIIGDSISTDVYGNYKKWVSDLLDSGVISRGYVTNSSQHATGYVATYASQANTTFIERLTALGNLSGYDIVITFGGINDWIQSVDFDDFKTAVDTYYSYVIENATQARIVVLTPLHTSLYGTNNSASKKQKDYDDYIKSVANDYAFPCLNLTDESGFCPDKSTTFSDMWTIVPSGYSEHDGVHPNADWEKKYLAPQIEQFLMGLIG